MADLYEEHAWLYDAAFSWDVEAEVAWLVERLGQPAALLDAGCGSGRMIPAFARHGVRVVGVDRSPAMLERARRRARSAGSPEPRLVRGELDGFQLGELLGGAICAIGTFAYLAGGGEAERHLACVAAHLAPGARYLVQLELRDPREARPAGPGPHGRWESEASEGRVRCTWFGADFDAERRIETQVSRFEVLSGPRAGLVVEAAHRMRVWGWADWRRLLDRTPLRQVAAWDGAARGRPALALGPELEGRPLVWHELAPAP